MWKATPTPNISDRAPAFGFPGELVDGNDPEAVRERVGVAVDRARRGEGPTLIELRTYRYVGHFIGDPEVYRTRDEVRAAREIDPVPRLERRLRDGDLLDDAQVAEIRAEVDATVYAGLDEARSDPMPDPSTCLAETYTSGVYPMGYSS